MKLRPIRGCGVRILVAGLFAAAFLINGEAQAKTWGITRGIDKFTDIESCRVEPGTRFGRAAWSVFAQAPVNLHFFAERRGAQVRAGIITEPLMPLLGDVQIRVDQNPVHTITAADTPVDSGQHFTLPDTPYLTPEQRASYETSMNASLAMTSPFKAYAGEPAQKLIAEILAGKVVIMRTVTTNAALTSAAEFKVDDGLRTALEKCAIVPAG